MTARRALVRGAAWAAPAVLVAVAAPAVATSPRPELGGLMRVSYSSSPWASVLVLTTTGTGLGLYVEGPVVLPPTSARLLVSLDARIAPERLAWTGSSSWSRPRLVESGAGVTTWELVYGGSWDRDGARWVAGAFEFVAGPPRVRGELSVRVRREVTVVGAVYASDSGWQLLRSTAAPAARSESQSVQADL